MEKLTLNHQTISIKDSNYSLTLFNVELWKSLTVFLAKRTQKCSINVERVIQSLTLFTLFLINFNPSILVNIEKLNSEET